MRPEPHKTPGADSLMSWLARHPRHVHLASTCPVALQYSSSHSLLYFTVRVHESLPLSIICDVPPGPFQSPTHQLFSFITSSLTLCITYADFGDCLLIPQLSLRPSFSSEGLVYQAV